MKKTLFTAAVAFVLSFGGVFFTAEAADELGAIEVGKDDSLVKLVFTSKQNVSLKDSLDSLSLSVGDSPSTFGYMNRNGDFISLADAVSQAQSATGDDQSVSYVLGKFNAGETFQFGYGNQEKGITSAAVTSTVKVASDAGYYAEYNIDSFYNQDFSQDPFDGMIEIYVMGEPLPTSTVTMLIALAAAGAFLLYRNRKTRARVVPAQV